MTSRSVMSAIRLLGTVLVLVILPTILQGQGTSNDEQWQADFAQQVVANRPNLDVNYADASRTAFRILAEEYRVTGELRTPHRLIDDDGQPWLWFELEDQDGHVYSTQNSKRSSRINLYRRGPYFCEVHWLDLQLATEDGREAPIKGDLALYCHPEKILAEITWHGTGTFRARKLLVQGIAPRQFDCSTFASGTRQAFPFALFGEQDPLPESAFTLHEGKTPMRYDTRKGYYVVGTTTSNSFQRHFYEMPNQYETATFSLSNDATRRKITICHETVIGGAIVEGGAVLDNNGHAMPIVVQVSKNFAGEREEKFYNPRDTPFSETYFPLFLEPGEKITLSSLHLYQNWGRHMTKHWSSLGAWMDYFHSSTGVTETTCYVPFKFGGIGGVSIADFRAMSQETYWNGQPQHDNLAGHSFLTFYDGQDWQHCQYERTIYRSTGPNWFDIQLNYISTDESIRVTADIWETPQVDELRSFFTVRYEILRPLVIDDAPAHFRFLSLTSAVQHLQFTRFAASGTADRKINFSQSPFPIKGHPLPGKDAYVAVYGDHVRNRGSNAVVIRKFAGPRGIGLAASVQTGPYQSRSRLDGKEDTRLLVVPDVGKLELQAGDVFEINGFWLPYGARDDASAPRRETVTYRMGAPRVTSCTRGSVLSDLPVRIRADQNCAEFSVTGGKDLLPVVVTGLTNWRYPRIWRREGNRWSLLSHARNTDHDGYQVFCAPDGTYGAVFLVGSDAREQHLRVSAGETVPEGAKISLRVENQAVVDRSPPSVTCVDPHGEVSLGLSFPAADIAASSATSPGAGRATHWQTSEGGSLWFEANEGNRKHGGRITPNQVDIDLEYWWQNNAAEMDREAPRFLIGLQGTPFEDPARERTWILTAEGWQKATAEVGDTAAGPGVVAVVSAGGKQVLCMAWPRANRILVGHDVGVALEPVRFPRNRRYHIRGKVYLMEGGLEILENRIRHDLSQIRFVSKQTVPSS